MGKDLEEKFLKDYETYNDAIFRHLLFKGDNRELAKDLTQDTFIKTWKYLCEGKQVDNMKAFLYRVAGNLLIDESRRKKAESLDRIMEEVPQFSPVDETQISLEDQALQKEVLETFSKLDEEDREIMTMRFIDGLEPREIAQILEITPNHVSVKLTRATRSLQAILLKGKK